MLNTKILCNLNDLINLYDANPQQLIKDAESFYQNQIKDVVNNLSNSTTKVILIAGPSSAGKTTTSKLLTLNLEKIGKKALVVSLDDFFIDRDKTPILPDGNYDYENIASLDIAYFNKFLRELIENNKAMMPIYDFITGKRKKELVPVEIDNKTIVVFEGIHALNPSLITFNSKDIKKIYIATNTTYIYQNGKDISPIEIRFMRRMLRDFYTRGHSISVTSAMWQNVLNGEIKYIDPYKEQADYKINSSHLYEPLLLSKYLKPLIANSKDKTIQKLYNFLDMCPEMNKSMIPNNSLLQEFFVMDN